MAQTVGSLQEQALKRKERLKALRGRHLQGPPSNAISPNWPSITKTLRTPGPSRHSLYFFAKETLTLRPPGMRKGREPDDEEPDRKRALEEETTENEERHRELKLRNYTPEDEELKERQVPKAKPISVEDKVKDQLEAANLEPVIEEVDLANLAPRKPDWDLKRDVAKKLEKLKRRTQKTIAELIRDRLKGSEEALADGVGSVGVDGESD